MKHRRLILLVALIVLLIAACAKRNAENPFNYPFIKPLHLKRLPGKPFSEYKAFYLLTEDFEPRVESAADIDRIREVLQFANGLSAKYGIHWTHFVDVSTLAPAFISDDALLKQKCNAMINDLKAMAGNGDDCQLHLHGPLAREFLDYLKAQTRLRVKPSGAEGISGYRQRKSFFFHSFYAQGYREVVTSLTYSKSLLEKSVYDGQPEVIAFRPGGWDHGSSAQDTFLYFNALGESGLTVNSGLVTGQFGTQHWTVGNYPGRNLATVTAGEQTITEISPTTGPGGYVNPVLPNDLNKLANAVSDEMPVIVSVYHLNALQADSEESRAQAQTERGLLESHFQTVADLMAKKVLYPITLRQLMAILAEQQ